MYKLLHLAIYRTRFFDFRNLIAALRFIGGQLSYDSYMSYTEWGLLICQSRLMFLSATSSVKTSSAAASWTTFVFLVLNAEGHKLPAR